MDIHKVARVQALPIALSLLRDLEKAWQDYPHLVHGEVNRDFTLAYAKDHPDHDTVVPALNKLHQTLCFLLIHPYPVERQIYSDELLAEGYECEPMDGEGRDWTKGFRVHAKDDTFSVLIK